MNLTAGPKLGSYEVLNLLGKGGMGEVYRARDTQLQRDVALKLLPDVLAAVLRAEPDWRKLPAETPPAIGRLLRRCLEKDRRERLPDIGVARLEIKDALAGPAETGVATCRCAAKEPTP